LSVGQALAGPTHAHMHRHRDVHAKKDIDVDWNTLDWDSMGVNWSKAWEEGQHKATTAPAPAATSVAPAVLAEIPAKSPAAAKPAASSSSDIVSDITSIVTTAFSDIKGLADGFTEFGARTTASGSVIDKIGNIGAPQCSNMIKVASAKGYPFTNQFINSSNKPITIAVWNKAFSPDGSVANAQANLGSCVAPVTPCLSITLAPGASQVVAFDEDSQGGWAEATTAIAKSGAYATTWAEFNYASSGGGFDVSAIMNIHGNTYDMEMSSSQNSCKSDMTQNLWIAQDNNPEKPVPVGNSDGSCFVPGGSMNLVTKMGGSTV